jgi:hypothetical protein
MGKKTEGSGKLPTRKESRSAAELSELNGNPSAIQVDMESAKAAAWFKRCHAVRPQGPEDEFTIMERCYAELGEITGEDALGTWTNPEICEALASGNRIVNILKGGGKGEEAWQDAKYRFSPSSIHVLGPRGNKPGDVLCPLRGCVQVRSNDRLRELFAKDNDIVAAVDCLMKEQPLGFVVVVESMWCSLIDVANPLDARWAILGRVALIDFVPNPQGKLLDNVRTQKFLSALAEKTMGALQSPGGLGAACTLLTIDFKMERQSHLSCATCCPTPESRQVARRHVFRSQDACSHKSPEKIIHVDWKLPQDLPEAYRSRTDWMDDPNAVKKCTEEMMQPYKGGGQFAATPLGPNHMMTQNREQLLRCLGQDPSSPDSTDLCEKLDKLSPRNFLASVHLTNVSTESSCMLLAELAFTKAKKASTTTDSFKNSMCCCDACGAQENISGLFKKCSGCRSASYCSVGCQTSAWPAHKAACRAARKAAGAPSAAN